VDYQLIDADNHYYEAEDAFTRYGDEEVNRFVRWLAQGKRRSARWTSPGRCTSGSGSWPRAASATST
jgi:hypothetical protein